MLAVFLASVSQCLPCSPQVFQHNNPEHLEAVLRSSIAEGQPRSGRAWKKVLVVVEGVYSMEGEMGRLREIVEVKKKYKVGGFFRGNR